MKTLLPVLASAFFAIGSAAAAQPATPATAADGKATAETAATRNLSPEDLVKRVTADVMGAIQKDKQLQAGDRDKALALAQEKILPHIDFQQAVQLAVGRAWREATPEQKQKLTDGFRQMLVRSYSSALDSYKGQTVRVLPSHNPPDANEATVRNQYIRSGAPPVTLEYAMHKTPEGWKIYDITVEGISLVLTYRGQFDQIVRQSGIDGLIKAMAEKNQPAVKAS